MTTNTRRPEDCAAKISVVLDDEALSTQIVCQGLNHTNRINGVAGDQNHRAVVTMADGRVLYIWWEVEEKDGGKKYG